MSTARRDGTSSGTSTEREQYLPVDVLLEIVARSDVTTVVRCTTASRTLRRAILDLAFRRRIATEGGAGGGFNPALLSSVSYRALHLLSMKHTHHVMHIPSSAQPRARLDASSLPGPFSFQPVASRDGLLLLHVYKYNRRWKLQLRVCDAFTGHATPLPRIAMSEPYAHVFLSVGDAGGSYEILVTDTDMRLQKFSSKHGQWGAVRQISIAGHETNSHRLDVSCPAVIGRTVYWPCSLYNSWHCWDRILAMDGDTAEGTIMELPLDIMMARKRDTDHRLASVCGVLSLLAVETGGISMWTLTPASATWSRQLVIDMVEIEKVVGPVDNTPIHFSLEGFGERSGAVIVWVENGDLLWLDLGTKVVKRLHNQEGSLVSRFFLHEIVLVSLLQAMKYF